MDIDPESLIPKLPSPKDLEPFPSKVSIVFKGHTDRVRCIDIDPTGQWLVSGSDDGTVRLWEICTGRNIKTYQLEEKVMSVSWNPRSQVCLFAAVMGHRVTMIQPRLGSNDVKEATRAMINVSWEKIENKPGQHTEWKRPLAKEEELGILLHVETKKAMTSVVWHRKGDYFATVSPDAVSSAVLIHQLSKATSQSPFKKSPGLVQRVLFHPGKPFLFVAVIHVDLDTKKCPSLQFVQARAGQEIVAW